MYIQQANSWTCCVSFVTAIHGDIRASIYGVVYFFLIALNSYLSYIKNSRD